MIKGKTKAKTYPLTRLCHQWGILTVEGWDFNDKQTRQDFVNSKRDTGLFYAMSLEDVADHLEDHLECIEPEEPEPPPETQRDQQR